MTYYPGTILKRQFADFQEVTVTASDEFYTTVRDATGLHFVPTTSIPTHFHVVSHEEPIQLRNEHSNLDDENRHNVAGSMNKPSRDQIQGENNGK